MKMIELHKKGKSLGLEKIGMTKTDIIHAIQRTEGYKECYGNSKGNCEQINCCFRDDCFKMSF